MTTTDSPTSAGSSGGAARGDGATAGGASSSGAAGSGTAGAGAQHIGTGGAPGTPMAPAGAAPKLDGFEAAVTVYDITVPGRRGVRPPPVGVDAVDPKDVLPDFARRAEPAGLPEVGELDTLRHYTRLSSLNFSIANSFYPLGSCTMKYNPLVNERVCALPGHAELHPMQPDVQVQGMLEVCHRTIGILKAVSGLHDVSLHPAAGAHGELTALMVMRAYLDDHGHADKKVILIPDSAHGTNPASCTMAGFTTRELKSNAQGRVSMKALEEVIGDGKDIAGLMITNPSTLGLFEPNIKTICEKIHAAGGLVYMDGANMNAILGRTRPGDFGVDVMHFNLHKTFSQPHGGGGPGAGPIAVRDILAPYLPVPKVTVRKPDRSKGETGNADGDYFETCWDSEKSIGRTRGFMTNAGVMVRSYTYMRAQGPEGMKAIADNAVLNANYLRASLKDTYRVWIDEPCMHEFVASAKGMPNGVKATDVAKRLIDYGVHPPTIYFPLIVPEALMIEPTETESKETLDHFVAVMKSLAKEAAEAPEVLKTAPHTRCIGRPDEVKAVKEPRVVG